MNINELIKKHIKNVVNENKPENYMFFGNIQQMKRQCELLMEENHQEIDGILKEHDWAQDHIAEAKSLLDQVFDFLMNETKKDIKNLNEEDLENDDSLSKKDIECLKKINNKIIRKDVIQWFNDNDIDYYNMTDIEMYIEYLENHKDESFLSEETQIDESKNKPTNPKLWSRAKSMAKAKFKVYPSAYANGWAAKWYKKHGGGWRKSKK